MAPHPNPTSRTPWSRRPVALATLLATLAGCTTVGPDFRPPAVDAPTDWAARHGGDPSLAPPAEAADPLPADRWAVFGDPALALLQAAALEANADLRTAALRLLQSRAEQATVGTQRGVQAGARAGVSRQRQSETGAGTRLVDAIGGPNRQTLLDVLSAPFTLYDAGFDASWEPDLWGRVLRSEEAAQAGSDGQQALLRQVRWSVAAEVARVYFGLRLAQRQQALLGDQLAVAQEVETLLAAQWRQGLADEAALNRQRQQRAGLQSLAPALRAQEAQAMNRLTLLCGAAPGALNDMLTAPAASPSALPDLRLGLPAALARRRPDIAAAEARLHAATARIGIAVADLYPRITLGASFGLESVGSRDFGDWGSRQWGLGPSLSLPIFDHGRRTTTITLRELQQQEAAVAFQQTVLAAWHEVDDAVSAYRAEVQRQALLQARAASATQDLTLAQARHANGMASYLPVLAATANVLDARRDMAESQARAQTAMAALVKSLGDEGGGGALAAR
jgi:NodT family efflux transporter outer membrane factor (OMF) lipoprotein